jgi:hypothetical protein
MASKRELIEPTAGDKRYVRRNAEGADRGVRYSSRTLSLAVTMRKGTPTVGGRTIRRIDRHSGHTTSSIAGVSLRSRRRPATANLALHSRHQR